MLWLVVVSPDDETLSTLMIVSVADDVGNCCTLALNLVINVSSAQDVHKKGISKIQYSV
jgi:hypothetical protein